MSVYQVVIPGSQPAPHLSDSEQVIPSRLSAIHEKHVVIRTQRAKGLELVLDEAAEAGVRLVRPHVRHNQNAISLSHSSFRVARYAGLFPRIATGRGRSVMFSSPA